MSDANAQLIEQFKKTKGEIEALVTKQAEEVKAVGAANAELKTSFETKSAELGELGEKLKATQAEAVAQAKRMDEMEAESKRVSQGLGGGATVIPFEPFFKSAEYKAFKGDSTRRKTGMIDVGRLFERKAGEFLSSEATRLIQPQRFPMVDLPQRRLRMRDIIPVVGTSSNKIEYLQETGFYKVGGALAVTSVTSSTVTATLTPTAAHNLPDGMQVRIRVSGAVETEYNGDFWATVSGATLIYTMAADPSGSSATGTVLYQVIRTQGGADWQNGENSAKSQSALEMDLQDADIRTLAHFLKISRQVAEDDAALLNFIQNSLLVGLAFKEDNQLLYGSGSSGAIQGLVSASGVQQMAWSGLSSGDTKIDALRKAMTRIQFAEYEATAVVVNPSDWQDVELQKDGNNAYVFGPTLVAQGAGSQFFKLPVVVTNAIRPGKALVGAFQNAAVIYERESGGIGIFEQDDDNVQKNMLTVRAEERIGLAVPRPEAFVYLDFDSQP